MLAHFFPLPDGFAFGADAANLTQTSKNLKEGIYP
jgi:hypothetical protein